LGCHYRNAQKENYEKFSHAQKIALQLQIENRPTPRVADATIRISAISNRCEYNARLNSQENHFRLQAPMFHFHSPRSRRLFQYLPLLALMFFAAPTGRAQDAALAAASNHASQPPQAIVIGFMGGNVSSDDPTRNELKISGRLRESFPTGTHFEIFENRRVEDAHQKILQILNVHPAGAATSAQPYATKNQSAQIILYGHSWGASAVVTLADELQRDGIPVTLTIQVDSIQKKGQQDSVIPANVARAVNFYQPDGLLHGRQEIRAADPSQTQILGNFRIAYKGMPTECSPYPWYERKFIKTHIAIECDPALWSRIESLIRDSLANPAAPPDTNDHAAQPTKPEVTPVNLASGRP
jgi:hypothetical protein